jgi:peptidyl-prolyl cis-trans isomerase B (cyclophilin B)
MSKRFLPVLLLLAAAAVAGCGDDDSGDASANDSSDETTTASPTGSSTAEGSAPASDVSCDYPTDQLGAAKENEPPPSTPTVTGAVTATVKTTIGDMTFTLDADKAPCTVNSFVSLAQQNYFNGTHCHRLTTSGIFVLQCGDPTASGTGGPGYTIPDELDGSEAYPAGTLAMAKTSAPNSGGSQFFIVYADTQLPPDYTVFGTVDDATVAAIADVASQGTDDSNGPGDGAPKQEVEIETVTIG